MERTYIMIKPDGVQRGLIGEIISRFEKKGFKLQAMKLATPPRELLEAHYADLSSKPFFPPLVDYMCSGPVCCMVSSIYTWRYDTISLILYHIVGMGRCRSCRDWSQDARCH